MPNHAGILLLVLLRRYLHTTQRLRHIESLPWVRLPLAALYLHNQNLSTWHVPINGSPLQSQPLTLELTSGYDYSATSDLMTSHP